MEWKQDAIVQDALKHYLVHQKDDLSKLLNALGTHNDGSPPFQFLQVFGKFIFRYTHYLEANTESDALELAISDVANDPTVQLMVGNMVQSGINRGLNIE
jgi:hypothetical protein